MTAPRRPEAERGGEHLNDLASGLRLKRRRQRPIAKRRVGQPKLETVPAGQLRQGVPKRRVLEDQPPFGPGKEAIDIDGIDVTQCPAVRDLTELTRRQLHAETGRPVGSGT